MSVFTAFPPTCCKRDSMRSLGLVSLFLFASVSQLKADYAAVVLADEPAAYWKLDDGTEGELLEFTGVIAPGEYEDRGGLELEAPGAIVGEAGTSVMFSESFGFGCSDLCGRGIVPVGGGLDFGTTENGPTISLEAWFQLTPNGEEVLPSAAFPRIFHYNNGEVGQYSFGVVGDDNAGFEAARTVWAARGDGNPDSANILAAPTDAVASSGTPEWYHFVAVLAGEELLSDGSAMRLYLNGLEQENLTPADPIFWQAPQATIGGRLQSNETDVVQSFPGLLDEIALYPTELTQEQIIEHYLVGIGELSGASCDFDGNGSCDVEDIDSLMNVIGEGSNVASFDLNADGIVDDADRDAWLAEAGPTNGFSGSFLVGDSNLDGTINATDLNAIGSAWQSDTNDWSSGNYTGSGANVADLNAMALNWQQSVGAAAASAVPEPECATLVWILLGVLGIYRRRRS